MDIAVIGRFLGRSGVLMAVVLLAGCAGTRDGTGGNPGANTVYYYAFSVTPVPATGTPTYIDVQPLAPTDGLYGGGNARIESKSRHETHIVVWRSHTPFWIRFERLKSNKGNGGNRFGPAEYTKSRDDGTGPYKYFFEQALPSEGGKTESAKYFLTFSGVDRDDPKKALGFELDPVIIVDR